MASNYQVSTQDKEKEIIKRIVSGDSELYRELVDSHRNKVYALTLRILGESGEAEEAAQDSFIKAYQNLNKFNYQSRFSTWLYRIAFNTAISYKRKHRIEKTQYEDSVMNMDSGESTDKHMMQNEQKIYIKKALRQLPDIDRTILTLYYLSDYSIEEVCKATGMKLSAVKVRLFRARKKMADELVNILPSESKVLIN